MSKKLYSFFILLTAFLWLGSGTMWGDELTVANDTWQKDQLPIDSYNCDAAQHNQFIYPASELQDMKGGVISGIKFHTVSASYSWSSKGSPTFTIKFAEVEATTLSGFNTSASFTQVYQGKAVFANSAWDITFDANYTYNGGNLLIDVESPAAGYISTVKFYSAEYANAGCAKGVGHSYLPKATFTYDLPVTGPGLKVLDGATKISTGYEYNFGLVPAGTTKTFTLSNPGTEATPVSVAHTGSYGATLSAASIPAGESIILTITMPDATGDDVITISSSATSIDDFTINVSGTVRDPNKLWCNFSEGLPDDWTNSGNYTINTTGGGTGTSGGGYAGQTSYSYKLMYTPLVSVAEGEKIQLLVAGYGSTASWNSMQIQYSADGSSWTTAKTISNIVSGSWTSVEVTEIPAGNWYIGFYGRYVYFTDVYGGTIPSAPKNVKAINITSESATITWNAFDAETAWQVSYSTTSGDPANGTLVNANSTSKEITGLTPETTYYVSVRIDNGGGSYSDWSIETSFPTKCGAKSISTWTDNSFENTTAGSGSLPGCWEAPVTYTYSDVEYPCVKSDYATDYGVQSLQFYGGSSYENLVVLPQFTEDLSTLTISFYYKNAGTSAYYGGFTVGYYKNGTFTAYEGGSVSKSSSYSAEPFELAIPNVPAASGACLAIKYAGGTYYNDNSRIDNLSIYPTPSCTKPSGVTVSNIIYNGATVTWTEDGSATNWKVQYSTDNSTWTTVNVSTNPTCTLTGLTTGTPYYVQVISVCGGSDGESPAVAAASTFTPTCVTPGVPSVSEKTVNSAKISWTVNSGEAEWNLQYKKSSDAEYTTIAGITENPYTLSGLASGYTYQVRVAATCNGSYTSAATFDTECEAKTLAGYTEGFEGFTTGSYAQTGLTCWGELNAVHSSSYSYPQMYVNTSSSFVKSGSKSLYFVSSGSTYEYAILPTFSGSYAGYQLTFSHKEESTSSSGKIALGYLTDASDVGTFQVIKEFTRSEDWVTETESINDVPTDARLAFRYGGSSSSNYYAGIDDISITELPNCLIPTVVTASNETTNSASISWTNGAEETSWKLQYSTDGTNWTAANDGNAFTTKPYTLEGLTANTIYYVQVKAVCGGTDGESEWSASGEFETDCNAIELADFATETFATNAVPECWRVTTLGDKEWATTTSNYQRHSSPYAMQFAAYTEAGNYSDLISPAITLTEDAFLKFYLYNSYSSDPVVGEVYIQYGSTTEKIFDFVATTNVEQQVVDLSEYTGKTAKFIFRGHGNGQSNYRYAAIDDVEIVAKPCDAPTGLSKEESSTAVTLSWTDEAASKWNLRWREVTEPESAWTNVENLTAKNLELSTTDGLVFGKTYEAQVQAVCTDVKSSDWSSLISFGLVCGAAPTNLTISARTASGATLNWVGAESAFSLETSLDGENWESPVAVNAKTYTFDGTLSAGTTYYVRVQNACGGEFATTSFTTWCDSKLSLPVELSSFSALPACWEVSPAGAISFDNNKLCFTGEGEKFLYLPQTSINLNLLSVTFTFSGSLEFGYIDEPNGTFHAFDPQPTSGVELDLAAEAAAAKYIAVRYNGASSLSTASISAISIRKTPTCLKPTGVAGTPGVGIASINWTNGGSETAWNLQYKLASAASWTDAEGTITNPFVLNGLEQGVSYKVRVQAACAGEELSDWSDEAEFTTNCEDVAALPFIETFDAALSNCWDITDEETATYAHSVYGSELRLPGGKATSGHLVKLPNITASLTNAVMTIEYKATTGANTAVPQVGYIDDLDAFQELAALDKSNTTTEARVALATANGKRLALRYDDGTSEGNFDIAEIRILEQLTLADNVDNTATLAALNGQTVDVTIGRTFVCADYFNTICLPFSLSAEELAASPIASNDLWAFKYVRVEGGELLIRIVEAESINAGEPYLISWPEGDNIENPLFKNVTISASVGKVMGNENLKFVGTLKPETFDAHDGSKLFLYQNNTLYWWDGDAASSLKSFRAFFTVEGGAGEMPIKNLPARIIKEEQETTGIDNTGVDAQALKLLENGCVVIIRNGVKYNIQGQVIEK